MNKQKKRTKSPISPLVKKLTMLLYIVIAIMSIYHHEITNLRNLLLELLVYFGLGIVINIIIKNVSITQFKKDIKMLFE